MKNSGQALLLVVLAMAAIITVVLSAVSRSVTDISVTSKEEDSLRAFSAAEAGVEQALLQGGSGTITSNPTFGDSQFTANVSSVAQGTANFVHPKDLLSGDSGTVWFVGHDPSTGNLVCNASNPCFAGSAMKVCWGKSGAAQVPAIEVSVLYDPNGDGNSTDLGVARIAVDPDRSGGRGGSNGFDAPDSGSCNINGTSFAYQKNISFSDLGISVSGQPNRLKMGRIRMLYNTTAPATFGVQVTGGTLPGQGTRIESTGQSGDSSRKVEVYTLYPEVPSVFDTAVFASGGVFK